MGRFITRMAKKSQVEEPLINLTPLIDVVFVILIMFILVAPLVEMEQVELADSKVDPLEALSSVEEASPVSIQVKRDNTVWVNGSLIDLESLTAVLKQAKLRHPTARPQLFHDRRAHFGIYQSVKNSAEIAGFRQMDIVLKPS